MKVLRSYTMLTINTDGNILTHPFNKLTCEKTMVVVLRTKPYADWLKTKPLERFKFILQSSAEQMQPA